MHCGCDVVDAGRIRRRPPLPWNRWENRPYKDGLTIIVVSINGIVNMAICFYGWLYYSLFLTPFSHTIRSSDLVNEVELNNQGSDTMDNEGCKNKYLKINTFESWQFIDSLHLLLFVIILIYRPFLYTMLSVLHSFILCVDFDCFKLHILFHNKQ